MKINLRKPALAGCAVLLAAGISLTAGTANAEEIKCSTPVLTSVPVQLADPGRWSYAYQVSWCVQDGQITEIVPHVTHADDGSKCAWVASMEESELPAEDGSGAWNAFNMGEFSCADGGGKPGTVNPWGIITVRPDGTSSVLRKGIGGTVID